MIIKKPQLIAAPEERHHYEAVSYETQHWSEPQSAGLSSVGVQKTRKKSKLGLVLRCVVTLLLFAFLFRSLSWATIWSTVLHIHRSVALVGLTIGIYTLVVSAYQWQSLLRTERIQIDLTRLINLYMVGIAFSHFLPTSMGGDVVKAYYVGRESNNTAGSASAVIMTRIMGFVGMLFVAVPAICIWHGRFSQQIILLLLGLSFLVLAMMVGIFFFTTLFARVLRTNWTNDRMTMLLPHIVRKKLLQKQIFAKVIDIGNTLIVSAKQPRSLLVATLFGVLFHIVACLNYFCYGLALRMDVPFYFYLVAIPLVSLIAFLPVSINGFGLRESALVYIFSTVHVPVATSLLLAFVMDLQTLFFGVLGGCVYLFMGKQSRQAQKKPGV